MERKPLLIVRNGTPAEDIVNNRSRVYRRVVGVERRDLLIEKIDLNLAALRALEPDHKSLAKAFAYLAEARAGLDELCVTYGTGAGSVGDFLKAREHESGGFYVPGKQENGSHERASIAVEVEG